MFFNPPLKGWWTPVVERGVVVCVSMADGTSVVLGHRSPQKKTLLTACSTDNTPLTSPSATLGVARDLRSRRATRPAHGGPSPSPNAVSLAAILCILRRRFCFLPGLSRSSTLLRVSLLLCRLSSLVSQHERHAPLNGARGRRALPGPPPRWSARPTMGAPWPP